MCSFDSSVGRAVDCRGNTCLMDINMSLVRIRLEGFFFFFFPPLAHKQIHVTHVLWISTCRWFESGSKDFFFPSTTCTQTNSCDHTHTCTLKHMHTHTHTNKHTTHVHTYKLYTYKLMRNSHMHKNSNIIY